MGMIIEVEHEIKRKIKKSRLIGRVSSYKNLLISRTDGIFCTKVLVFGKS
jgi:hypothetical protein